MSQPQTNPVQEFRATITGKMRDEIAKQLPKDIDVERFIRTALTAVQLNPDLLQADRGSLYGALMQCAKDGLLPDGKEATIQVYNTNVARKGQPNDWRQMASYMPMVGGLIRKMYEAGCTYVDGAAVYQADEFSFQRGDQPRILHEPSMSADDPGPVIAAYAVVKLAGGETKREVMPRRDIEKVRQSSKSPNGPGWTNWYDQFAIKAVLKRIYKQLPHTSAALERVIEADNKAMGFESWDQKPQETPALENQSGRSSRLESIVQGTSMPDQAPARQTDIQF